MKLGTYTTFDSPTGGEEVESRALEFLKNKFDEIDGRVRKIQNAHDFGMYVSFEIDYPRELENVNDFADDDDTTAEDYELQEAKENKLDEWHLKANEIEAEYSEAFAGNL